MKRSIRNIQVHTVHDAVRKRLLALCDGRRMNTHMLSERSGVAESTIKNILYSKSQNTGIQTLKKLCDGLDIGLPEFFDCDDFWYLDDEEI